ncbi:MAG TPA: hypothetical protein VGF30_10785 [Bacteroidia bacterium]
MKKNNDAHKDELISYIRKHSVQHLNLPLEKFRLEALVIMKVELELCGLRTKENRNAIIGLV